MCVCVPCPNGLHLPVWFYLGMAGAFCFILIQLVLLIDFAHSWNESWVEKMEEGNSRCWYAGMVRRFLNNHLGESCAVTVGQIWIEILNTRFRQLSWRP